MKNIKIISFKLFVSPAIGTVFEKTSHQHTKSLRSVATVSAGKR